MAEKIRDLPAPGTRGHTQQPLKAYAFPPEDVPGRHWSSRGSHWYSGTPNTAGLDESSVRQFLEYVDSRGPSGLTFDELISTTGTPPEFIEDLHKRGLLQFAEQSTGGPYPKTLGHYVRVPPGTRSKLLKGATAGLAGLGATGLAKVAAAKSLGVLGGPVLEYALDPEVRTPGQFFPRQEEFITGLPGLVSPSELPPPAVLSPDRLKAVEALHGMVGVSTGPKEPNVTVQEVRAYVKNRVAKGKKLPKWAESITSMKNGRLVIKPINPRKKARQEAAKRPHNPRVGTKRKYGGY